MMQMIMKDLVTLALLVSTCRLSAAFSSLRFAGTAATSRKGSLSASVFEEWQEFSKAQTSLSLLNALVKPKQSLQEVVLVGQGKIPTSRKVGDTSCLVLSTTGASGDSLKKECLFVPVTDQQLKLLSFTVQDKPLSWSVLLGLNSLLVNRDGALFDNIPWSTWTVDPQMRNRDAANNAIQDKFHLGKRDAFARFTGKDWKGRSANIGNFAVRLKYALDQKEKPTMSDVILVKRILELQRREVKEELAEADYELAVARQNFPEQVISLEEKRSEIFEKLCGVEQNLDELSRPKTTSSMSVLGSLLDRIAESTIQGGKEAAPYRGATGYPPMLDTEDHVGEGDLPLTSPFGLMKEVLEDQCKAKVIGALLENASLLDGTLVVGGAIVLQRITAKTTFKIDGQELSVNDETEDYGSSGLKGGSTVLVECDVDEAIGMALTYGVPIQVEREIWDEARIMALAEQNESCQNVLDTLPHWKPTEDISFLVEGQSRNESVSDNPSRLRMPLTTSLFDSLFESSGKSAVFPTDNPVKSLAAYDSMSDSDKAKTLIELSSFNGKIPRPRILRSQQASGTSPGPLDDLLLPLIDEAVRRQYLIRDAEARQDYEAVRQLEDEKSKRQVAREIAEEAREDGDEETAQIWDDEAEFYDSLRADTTQDDGSYSRFLDRDEWYERERQARVKKLSKKKFGTLLDGTD
jgi:hypothetical protein